MTPAHMQCNGSYTYEEFISIPVLFRPVCCCTCYCSTAQGPIWKFNLLKWPIQRRSLTPTCATSYLHCHPHQHITPYQSSCFHAVYPQDTRLLFQLLQLTLSGRVHSAAQFQSVMTVDGHNDAHPRVQESVLSRFNFTVCGVLFVFIYLYWVDVAYVVGA